jgi:hypothetical protein
MNKNDASRTINTNLLLIIQSASETQATHCYINETYLPSGPLNEPVYEVKELTTNEMFHEVSIYTSCLDDKSPTAFARWCSSRKMNFLQAKDQRKRLRVENETFIRYRTLYVIKKKYCRSCSQ